ncbi:MAG: glutathione S-transferase family protein, partial [Mesorhizobium sp.]
MKHEICEIAGIPGGLVTDKLVLVSHHLCPYVQRAAISLCEKDVPFERLTIDL